MSPSRFPISVMASAISNDPRAAAAGVARSLGFSGLQFAVQSAMIDLHELSVSGRRDFCHMLAANAQTLESLFVDAGVKGLMPGGDTDRVIARLDKAMETAAGLACRLVCVDIGPLPAPPPEVKPRKPVRPEEAGIIIIPTQHSAPGTQDFDGLVAASAEADPTHSGMVRSADPTHSAHVDSAIVELGRRADRYGVTLAFGSELAPLASIERALRAAGCAWFGVDLDAVALLRDPWDIDEAFSRLAPLIRHVRVRDAVLGHAHMTKPALVGQGSTDWKALLGRLEDAGYHGWLEVDPTELTDRTAAAQAAGAFLRAIR
ncbi:MAG: sugar phosphate isomerase/epimerase family protein [Tepidisphaerales bacterium]